MKFPYPKFLERTPVKVYATGVDKYGDPFETEIYDGLAFYDEKQRQVMNAERQLVLLSGLLIIEGDIYPNKEIEGYILIGDDIEKKIYGTNRPRNPDGTVYSTELSLS